MEIIIAAICAIAILVSGVGFALNARSEKTHQPLSDLRRVRHAKHLIEGISPQNQKVRTAIKKIEMIEDALQIEVSVRPSVRKPPT